MSLSRLVSIGALLSLALGLSVLADPPAGKKPWEWTLEERLAVRFDPALIAERQAAEEAHAHAAGAQPSASERQNPQNYGIDGNLHPELLLPHEVFRMLLGGFAPDEKRRMGRRASLREAIAAMGFDEEIFWAKLRSAAGRYIDTYVYPEPGTVAPASRDGRDACREAFLALSSARQVFGQQRLDRLLYEELAPLMRTAYATTAKDPAAELRFEAGGCQ